MNENENEKRKEKVRYIPSCFNIKFTRACTNEDPKHSARVIYDILRQETKVEKQLWHSDDFEDLQHPNCWAEDSPFRVQQLNRSSVTHTFAEFSYETHLINDALAPKGVSLKIVPAHNQTAYASIDVCAHSCTAAISKTSTEPSPFFTWPLSPSKISTMFL